MMNRRAVLTLVLSIIGTPLALAQVIANTPVSLEQVVALAEAAPDVTAARVQLEAAMLELEIAKSPVSANLDVSADQEWDLAGDTQAFSATATANATLNVLPFGSAAESATRAEQAVIRARLGLEAARAESVTTAVTQFASALRAAQQVEILEETFALTELRLEAVLAQREAGAANDTQVLQSRIDLTSAGNDLASAGRDGLAAISDLSQTLGVAIDAVGGEMVSALPPEAVDVAEQLPKRRDVLTAKLEVVEADLALAAARRNARPSVALDLSYSASTGGTSLRLGAGIDTRSFQPNLSSSVGLTGGASGGSSSRFGIGVGVSVPLDPTAGANLASYEISLERAAANVERTVSIAEAEIANLQRVVDGAEAQVQLTARLLEQTEAALAAARTQFDLGLVSTLDLRDTEISLLQASLRVGEAQDTYLVNAMRLASALALDPLSVMP